jgi:FixJ family two-component response regulator
MFNGSGAIAVVDDDSSVLYSLKFLLEVAGHRVAIYDSGKQFLESSFSQLTCLIVDQHMPGMTGLELVARLGSQVANVPVMLITGSPSAEIVAKAALLGVEMVLEKPPTEEDLLRFVTSHARPC